jgi:hypothetical protein
MKNPLAVLCLGIVVILIGCGLYQAAYVSKAHRSFDNYYAFRGCEKLISKTDTSAVCQTSAGTTITIVEYKNEWYLDGDLPCPNPGLSLKYLVCLI